MMKLEIRKKGGPGSGDFGHAGRPGKQGGSAGGRGGGGTQGKLFPRGMEDREDWAYGHFRELGHYEKAVQLAGTFKPVESMFDSLWDGNDAESVAKHAYSIWPTSGGMYGDFLKSAKYMDRYISNWKSGKLM